MSKQQHNNTFVRLFVIAASIFFALGESRSFHLKASSPKKIKGIRNVGGSCFANATAQCLFRIESVKNFVLRADSSSGQPEISGLKELFSSLDDPSSRIPVTGGNGKFIPSQFPRGQMGDSEEFYTAWLDILERNGFEDLQSELMIQVELTRIRSETVETSSDKWTSIRVTFPQSTNKGRPYGIDELLSRPEGPFGEEQLGESLIQFYRIAKLPKIMVLNLVRGGYDSNYNPVKIETPVNLPEIIDFAPYISVPSGDNAIKTRYRLKMFVTHTGSNPQSGHYFAHARESIESAVWSRLDDENVQTVNNEQAMEAVKSATLVFYEQIN